MTLLVSKASVYIRVFVLIQSERFCEFVILAANSEVHKKINVAVHKKKRCRKLFVTRRTDFFFGQLYISSIILSVFNCTTVR